MTAYLFQRILLLCSLLLCVRVYSSYPVCGTAASEGVVATLTCPTGSVITAINFASYGTPTGSCGAFSVSSCNAPTSVSVVQSACLNQASCSVASSYLSFSGDPCYGVPKHLFIQATCGVFVTERRL